MSRIEPPPTPQLRHAAECLSPSAPRLELWGGIECTVARIGDSYRDQVVETGHRDRPGDLATLAALGLRTLRYPVLWETVQPSGTGPLDWSWHDERLAELRALGIAPIAGLVHHGSGPPTTNLLDPAFPELLAAYAGEVARRYPWIEAYTPVNEPLTTARFSALYGHWYPHRRDEASFLRAVVQQCRAVVLGMQAIRRVVPGARLVQTEDLGFTFSTPRLRYQAAYENGRRWLTLDLLCGRIGPGHPWHAILLGHGIERWELDFFREQPCPPDIVGINHYLTSERYLDHRRERYPEESWGGNGRHRYADVEAVRMPLPRRACGAAARLREAWARYRLPLAITEVHHGCSRDEQLRWFLEVWNGALTARAAGADVRAVTLWSLLGVVDWRSLLLRRDGHYEPGAFDIRGGIVRPTILAKAAAALQKEGSFDHPTLDGDGWWRRPTRRYGGRRTGKRIAVPRREILVAPASGAIAEALVEICETRGLACVRPPEGWRDPADLEAATALLRAVKPWAVVWGAGMPGPATSAAERRRRLVQVQGGGVLAAACRRAGIRFVALSSGLVFDGRLGRAYVESDPVAPACLCGQHLARIEAAIAAACPEALVLRSGRLFGLRRSGQPNLDAAPCAAHGHRPGGQGEGEGVLTYVPDFCHAALDLLIDGETGLWHLTNPGMVAWADLAPRLRQEIRVLAPTTAGPRCCRDHGGASLSSERGALLPAIGDALERYIAARGA
jgi:dTDP-4-dehydrorhamnose reductase